MSYLTDNAVWAVLFNIITDYFKQAYRVRSVKAKITSRATVDR